jgi:PAS domain S-box-containing protein
LEASQLRAIYESALDAFLIADDEGRYVSANPAACALLGLSEADILGRRVADFMAPGFDFEQAWGAFLGQGRGRGEMALLRPDGSTLAVEYSAISNVLPGRHLSILRDVSDRKRAEDALELLALDNARLYRQAEAANQAKDLFLATLSHELRTPLTPVLALVSKLERAAAPGEALHRDLSMIRKNVELEARLIDDLLDLTRIARGKIELHSEAIPIHPLVEHAIQICCAETVAAGLLTIDVELRAPDPVAWADGSRLTQVFWNLLSNAVKFTPAGGTIRVRTAIEAAGGVPVVAVEIADTGLGIDPAVLPRIFEAFEQGEIAVTRRFGGLGLGLAVSKAILDVHGGSLAAASPGKGRGTTMTARLPLYQALCQGDAGEVPRDAPRAAGGDFQASGERPLSILLVEDHADTADAVADLLRDLGHRVEVAGSVAAALAAAGPGIDLVISDLGLPDGSGLDLMRALKGSHGLRGIALSGYGTEEDRRQSEAAGFTAHLTKPVSLDTLLAEIRRAGLDVLGSRQS